MIKIAILLFTFMTAMDTTILATVMPEIIRSLGQMELYPLMSAAFFFAFFTATPIFGKVVDHFGCMKSAWVAVGLFLLGSLFCGLSFSMHELIVSRLIQGAGAGGLVNICYITIAKLYTTDRERSFMQAILSSVWAVASIVGPFIGASLTMALSWRWAFLINLPIGAIAASFLWSFREKNIQHKDLFDTKGVILFLVSAGLLFSCFTKAAGEGQMGWKVGAFVLGAIALVCFVRRSFQVSSPLIPFRLLSVPGVALCIAFGFITGICLTTSATLVSLYIQGAMRLSVRIAGFVVTASSIGWVIGAFLCSYSIARIGWQWVACVAIGAVILGFSLFAFASIHNTLLYFIVACSIIGLGLGPLINLTILGVQKAAEAKLIGRATTFLSLTRTLGAGIGAAFAGFLQLTFFQKELRAVIGDQVSQGIGEALINTPSKFLEPAFIASIPPAELSLLCELFSSSIEKVFFVPIVLLLAALSCVFFLLPLRKRSEWSVPLGTDH